MRGAGHIRRPGQPAAQYNNLVADFVLLLVVVVHNHYIRSGQSRDRHDQRSGACRNDQCVRMLRLYQLLRGFAVQADLYAGLYGILRVGARSTDTSHI